MITYQEQIHWIYPPTGKTLQSNYTWIEYLNAQDGRLVRREGVWQGPAQQRAVAGWVETWSSGVQEVNRVVW